MAGCRVVGVRWVELACPRMENLGPLRRLNWPSGVKKVVFLQVGNFTLLLADINDLCLLKTSVRQVL